jgi:hypothetical protein
LDQTTLDRNNARALHRLDGNYAVLDFLTQLGRFVEPEEVLAVKPRLQPCFDARNVTVECIGGLPLEFHCKTYPCADEQ